MLPVSRRRRDDPINIDSQQRVVIQEARLWLAGVAGVTSAGGGCGRLRRCGVAVAPHVRQL
jgi:hypothetical protein